VLHVKPLIQMVKRSGVGHSLYMMLNKFLLMIATFLCMPILDSDNKRATETVTHRTFSVFKRHLKHHFL